MAKRKPTTVVDRTFLDTAPLRFEATRQIDATSTATFNCLADQTTWSNWLLISSAEWTSPPPYGIGSTRLVRARRSRNSGTQVVVAWEPGHRIAFCNTDTPRFTGVKSFYEEYTLVPNADGTCMATLRMANQLQPFLFLFELSERVAAALLGGRVAKLILGRLSKYVDRHEGRFLPPPAPR